MSYGPPNTVLLLGSAAVQLEAVMDEPTRAFKYVQVGAIPPPPGPPPSGPRPRAVWATVLLLIFFLGLRIYTQSVELQALKQPRLDIATRILASAPSRGGGRNDIALPRTTPVLLEIPYLDSDKSYPSYRVDLREPSGALIWSGSLHPANGGFTVYLPAGFLPPTACEIELYGVRPEGKETITFYEIVPARSANP